MKKRGGTVVFIMISNIYKKTKKRGKDYYVHNDIKHLQKPKSKYMIFINKYQSKGLLILPAPGGLSLHSHTNPATV